MKDQCLFLRLKIKREKLLVDTVKLFFRGLFCFYIKTIYFKMKTVMLNDRTFLHRLSLTATWNGETIAVLQHNAADLVQSNLVFQEEYHQSWTSFLPSLEGGKSVCTFEIEIEMLNSKEGPKDMAMN